MAQVPPVVDFEDVEDSELEVIESELADHEASLRTFEILTYPADYTLEVLVDKWRKNQITIPRFQRRFVWTQVQSSKLVESFLLGLPVPAIFLYSDPDTNKLLVVDGQQRLKTIAYFFEGFFGAEEKGKRAVFRLSGLEEHSPYLGKTYEDLELTEPAAFTKLNDAVLRAFVIKQLDPEDDTSIYHVFERLNTGGTLLHPQEIRNCIHQGALNDLLISLNDLPSWRAVYGRPRPDKRQRDVELILRFLGLLHGAEDYEKPMKDFLNRFMRANRHPSTSELEEFRTIFANTTAAVLECLGERPFHVRAGLNAAVYDSVYVAFAGHLSEADKDGHLKARYRQLLRSPKYLELVGSATTDKDVVRRRLAIAEDVLFAS